MLNLTGTGNTVADYRVSIEQCSDCYGTGYKKFGNLKEMLAYLREAWPMASKIRFFDALHFAREFRREGEIQCQTCEGEGTVEIWR